MKQVKRLKNSFSNVRTEKEPVIFDAIPVIVPVGAIIDAQSILLKKQSYKQITGGTLIMNSTLIARCK